MVSSMRRMSPNSEETVVASSNLMANPVSVEYILSVGLIKHPKTIRANYRCHNNSFMVAQFSQSTTLENHYNNTAIGNRYSNAPNNHHNQLAWEWKINFFYCSKEALT
jgi:hypothetical protein